MLLIFVSLATATCTCQANSDKARVIAATTQVDIFKTALRYYRADTGEYPPTAVGLQALRTPLPGIKGWNGPYLQKEIPMDTWGRPYTYKYPGDHGSDPDIACLGADGQPGGEGLNADIVNWK